MSFNKSLKVFVISSKARNKVLPSVARQALIFFIIFVWIFTSFPVIWQSAKLRIPTEIEKVKAVNKTIEQQINIIDQEYTTGSTSYVPIDNSLGIIQFDPSKYSAETLYFEAVLKTESGGSYTTYRSSFSAPVSTKEYTVRLSKVTDSGCTDSKYESKAQLYSITDSAEVASVEDDNCTASGGPNGDSANIKAARLIIIQSDATSITDTETQIEVGNHENTTDTSYADLIDKKIYYYDSLKFDPAPTINFEVTIKNDNVTGGPTSSSPTNCGTSANDSTVGTVDWSNVGTPGYACGSENNRSSVTLANTISKYLKVTNFGFDIPLDAESIDGIVIGFERIQNANANNDVVDNAVRIVKADGSLGTEDKATADDWPQAEQTDEYGSSGDTWSESWTPLNINDSDFGVVISAKDKGVASKAVVGEIDNVVITVYYTTVDAVATTSVRLWNKTNGVAVTGSEVSTTSTSWTRIRTGSPITLTTDKEYVVQIQTSNANATARIANAKIILDQANAGGIDKVEIIHQYVNTPFPISLSGSTTYARLAVAGGATVEGSTASTTIASNYTRIRPITSISLTDNDYDTEIAGGDLVYTQTDYDNQYTSTNWTGGIFIYYFEATIRAPQPYNEISNSWLIIQASNLASATLTVNNVQLNSQAAIDLIENTTKSVSATADISHPTACNLITNVLAKIYRFGVTNGKDCTPDNNNCYSVASCTETSCVGTDAVYTCTINMQFHADPTDTGSTWESEYWQAWIEATDGTLTESNYSPADAPEVNTLSALNIDPTTINYDTVNPDNVSSEKTVEVQTTGNASIDVKLSGINMTWSGNTILVEQQKYSTSTGFDWETEGEVLDGTLTCHELSSGKPTDNPTNATENIYWKLKVPTGKAAGGPYTGSNTFEVASESSCP